MTRRNLSVFDSTLRLTTNVKRKAREASRKFMLVYLRFVIGIAAVLDQQIRHVVVALLRAQVQRGETRFGFRVRVRPALQKRGGDVHLAARGRGGGGSIVLEE